MARPARKSTPVTKTFADKLSDLIAGEKDKKKITQKEIAAAIGVPDSSLSEWCNDSQTASIDAIYKIAKHFNVSADYLLGISETPTVEEDMKIAEKVTGLSDEATQMLKVYSKEPNLKPIIDLLNELILDMDTDGFSTLSQITSVVYAICACQGDPYYTTMQGSISLAGLHQKCQNSFMQFVDRYTKK